MKVNERTKIKSPFVNLNDEYNDNVQKKGSWIHELSEDWKKGCHAKTE